MRVEIDTRLCVVSGMCVAVAPEVFALAEDGNSVVVRVVDFQPALVGAAENAALCCPVGAIEVTWTPGGSHGSS